MATLLMFFSINDRDDGIRCCIVIVLLLYAEKEVYVYVQ